jgi:septal ring factor EnvC (AmiA/AmiB activator)
MLIEAITTLKAQTKQLQDIRRELASNSTPLLEAINTIKAQTKELQDLKAEIASLKSKGK